MTDEDDEVLRDRMDADHARYAGRVVTVHSAWVGNGDDRLFVQNFPGGVRVRIGLSYDWRFDRSQGGLYDTDYDADVVNPADAPEGFSLIATDGPTYYLGGRVEHPKWFQPEGHL